MAASKTCISALPHLERVAVAVLRGCVAFAIVALLGVVLAETMLRTSGQRSLRGAEELGNLFALWAYYLGMALVSLRGGHITGGVLSIWLDDRRMAALRGFYALICAALSAWFLIESLEYLQFILRFARKSTALRLPSAIWYSSLIVGLGLSVAGLLIRAALDQGGMHDG